MSKNFWKTAFTLFVIFQITQAWEMVCYKGSLSNFKRVTYTNCTDLITSGYYDINQKGVTYAFGYRGSLTTEGTNNITAAFLQLYGINVCAVDWSKEANEDLIPYLNFPVVIKAAEKVQGELAQCLKMMWENGMNPSSMHAMGLSLGAHLIGNACRTFSELTNMTIGRATGVDAAKPGFDGTSPLFKRIDRTCADFVDMCHSDTKRYGMATAVGDVDFFPNLNTYDETGVQPGCDPVNYILNPPLTPGGGPYFLNILEPLVPILYLLSTIGKSLLPDACSHRRCLDLYIESMTNECQLLGAQAVNETVWESPDFIPGVVGCMGEYINQTLRGNFYLVTRGQSPYGLKEAGLKASYN